MQEVNVQVAVRVRPLLPKERVANEAICVKILPNTNQLVIGKDKAFTFDYCLPPKVTQDQLYQKCVDPLVKSCFEGYNATVFAYGQTGSGKTYTIGGGSLLTQTEEELGVIPRAVKQIYDAIQSDNSRVYTVKLSYFEVYKEELKDLLDLESPTKDLHIREDNKANTVIMGASELECETMDEVMLYLERGSASRRTGSTQMNEHSSRSHSVFTLLIEQRWSDAEEGLQNESQKPNQERNGDTDAVVDDNFDAVNHYMCSKFHFVDLAGSERAHRTGNAGNRLKESIHINSGLLALGNVISCLGDSKRKVAHIPYRDSKITRILKDSLGGNAKTLMICCISPASSNLDESLNALKYANRARNIKNMPVVNRDPRSIRFEEMQSEIKALREELQRQRTYGITSDTGTQRAPADLDQMRLLEEKVSRLDTECCHYRMIADEAFKQLSEVKERDLMSHSQVVRLGDWLELMEEIKNKVPATLSQDISDNQIILRLERELEQCKRDLQSDEEIFAEKTQDIQSLIDKVAELESANAELLQRVEELEASDRNNCQLLLLKQIELDQLQMRIKQSESVRPAVQPDDAVGPRTPRQRALSVPVHVLGNRMAAREACSRNIHTSPAVLTFDRVVQSFRARSQLLVAQLEEEDEVLEKTFPDETLTLDAKLSDRTPSTSKTRRSDEEADGRTSEAEGMEATRSLLTRSDIRRGTYRVKRPQQVRPLLSRPDEDALRKSQTDDEKLLVLTSSEQESDGAGMDPKMALDQLKASTSQQLKQLKLSELDMRQSTQKMKDLAVNIRLKEQLIRELVKTGQESQQVNRQYQRQVAALQKEKDEAVVELNGLQMALKELENKEKNDKVKTERLQTEFQKKMELANVKIHALQRKQKDMEKMATLTTNDKRIHELEVAVERMRQQQEQLQRRLREEQDRKTRLERDLQKEQQRMREMELLGEQQKKVMKVKMEEMSLIQRKLRSGAQSSYSREEQARLEEQKKWLDLEMEKVLEQRAAAEELEKELGRREEIIAKKEAMLAEKSELEIKKLRSSQVINKDIIMVSSRLETVEQRIKEKKKEVSSTPRDIQGQGMNELTKLMKERDKLKSQRSNLEAKMNRGALLSTQEDRRLIELDEAVEALDAAIDFKNELISSRQAEAGGSMMRSVVSSEDGLISKLASLSVNETRVLLARYFSKVIDLKDGQRQTKRQYTELEVKLDEQESVIRDLELSLQQASAGADRKLTKLQQEYERKIQLLMRRLMEKEAEVTDAAGAVNGSAAAEEDIRGSSLTKDGAKDARIAHLEKELHYYKTMTRELKKKFHDGSEVNLSRSINSGMKRGLILSGLTERDLTSGSEKLSRDPLLKAVGLRGLTADNMVSNIPDDNGAGDRLRTPNFVLPTTVAPVRVSRRDLRRLSSEELLLRRATEQDANNATW